MHTMSCGTFRASQRAAAPFALALSLWSSSAQAHHFGSVKIDEGDISSPLIAVDPTSGEPRIVYTVLSGSNAGSWSVQRCGATWVREPMRRGYYDFAITPSGNSAFVTGAPAGLAYGVRSSGVWSFRAFPPRLWTPMRQDRYWQFSR